MRKRFFHEPDVLVRPGVSYTVRQLMKLQQSAVIPDGILHMDNYTPKEMVEKGVHNPLNAIGLDLDDVGKIQDFRTLMSKDILGVAPAAPTPPPAPPVPTPPPAPSAE